MILPGPCNYRFTFGEFPLFTRNVKPAAALQHEIDLVGVCVAVNALILSRSQAVQIAKVFRRIEYRQLLHFVIGKANEILKSANFHSRVRPIVVEQTQKGRKEFTPMKAATEPTYPESDLASGKTAFAVRSTPFENRATGSENR